MALRHLIAELKALVEVGEGHMGGGGGHGGGGHGGGHGHGRFHGGIVGVGPWWGNCPPGYEVMSDGSCKKVEEAVARWATYTDEVRSQIADVLGDESDPGAVKLLRLAKGLDAAVAQDSKLNPDDRWAHSQRLDRMRADLDRAMQNELGLELVTKLGT